MKKTILNIVAIAATSLLATSCHQKQQEQMAKNNNDSILAENIQLVIIAEEQSSANNKAYAQKAKEENHKHVANMFTAKAKADSIRAEGHKKTLAKIADPAKIAAKPAPKAVVPKTTPENLKQSINDDEYQITIAYPNYIEQAVMVGDSLTITTLQWAVDGRENDQQYAQDALKSVANNGNDMAVSQIWFVCPQCGSISDSISMAGTQSCNQCGMMENDFIVIGK